MMNGLRIALLALPLMGCVEETPMSNGTPEMVGVGQMPAFCRGAAAERFAARPMDVTTLPAEPDQGMYTVPGEVDGTFFACTFTEDGRLVGVDRV